MSYRAWEGCRSRIVGMCMIAASGSLIASAGHAADSWEVLLSHQLREEQRCVLDKVLSVREVPVGKIVGLQGRIRCTDTREYDFEREHENQKFKIRLCQPEVC